MLRKEPRYAAEKALWMRKRALHTSRCTGLFWCCPTSLRRSHCGMLRTEPQKEPCTRVCVTGSFCDVRFSRVRSHCGVSRKEPRKEPVRFRERALHIVEMLEVQSRADFRLARGGSHCGMLAERALQMSEKSPTREYVYLTAVSCRLPTKEWRRPIGCLISCIIFRKRATNYRALLRKMTCKDKASYESSPPCISWRISLQYALQMLEKSPTHEYIYRALFCDARLSPRK